MPGATTITSKYVDVVTVANGRDFDSVPDTVGCSPTMNARASPSRRTHRTPVRKKWAAPLPLPVTRPDIRNAKYVKSVTVGVGGKITIEYGNTGKMGGNPTMDGAKTFLTPNETAGPLQWKCEIESNSKTKYVPSECPHLRHATSVVFRACRPADGELM
jgi:hypothetical protein